MRKIVLVNQKGGCGKTTTALNLSYCLATTGRKVLLLDLDPQGHVALGFGVKPDQIQGSIYEVLLGQIPVTQAIQTLRENLDAVLSDVLLSAFEQVMAGAREREFKLKRCLADLPGKYDYLIMDSPPSLGLLTFNALLASEEVIIPVEPSFFSVQGLQRLLETIQVVETKTRHRLSVKILATNFDRRTKFCRDMLACLQATFPEHCLATIIHTCTALREAAGRGKPIGEYGQRCGAFADYQGLAKEVLNQELAPRATSRISTDLQTVDFAELVAQRSQAQKSITGAEGGVQEAPGREVIFTLTAPAHAAVQIAGDFNNWMPESLEFAESQGAQVWHKAICLKPGSYEYKYVIDGRWAVDPHNSRVVDDPYGGVNSQLNV